MNLMMRGSNSRAGIQSAQVQRVFCDERLEWNHGTIDVLRKRLRTYHNSIEIGFGTAGREGDELHSDWLEVPGPRRIGGVRLASKHNGSGSPPGRRFCSRRI